MLNPHPCCRRLVRVHAPLTARDRWPGHWPCMSESVANALLIRFAVIQASLGPRSPPAPSPSLWLASVSSPSAADARVRLPISVSVLLPSICVNHKRLCRLPCSWHPKNLAHVGVMATRSDFLCVTACVRLASSHVQRRRHGRRPRNRQISHRRGDHGDGERAAPPLMREANIHSKSDNQRLLAELSSRSQSCWHHFIVNKLDY